MTAAYDAQVMKSAREAIHVLLKHPDELLPRSELFSEQQSSGTIARFQNRLLARLEEVGLITKVKESTHGTACLWGLTDTKAIMRARELSNNDVQLSALFWPSAQPQLPAPQLPTAMSEAEAAPDEDENSTVLSALTAVLKALRSVADSLAGLHDKIDKLPRSTS